MDGIEPSTVAEMLLGAVAVVVLVVLVRLMPSPLRSQRRRLDEAAARRPAAPDTASFVAGPSWTIDSTPNTPEGRWITLARPAFIELTAYWPRGDTPTIHLLNPRGEWMDPDVQLPGRGEPVLLGLGATTMGLVLRPTKRMSIRVDLRVPPDAGFELRPGSILGDR